MQVLPYGPSMLFASSTCPRISTVDMNEVPRDVLQKATCLVLGSAFAQVLTVDQMIDKLSSA